MCPLGFGLLIRPFRDNTTRVTAGTVIWMSPAGQTYRTVPGSKLPGTVVRAHWRTATAEFVRHRVQ